MQLLNDYMKHNYRVPDTEGPKYEEVMQILMNINEEKATTGNIKPQIIKLGSKWGHDILYRIIR